LEPHQRWNSFGLHGPHAAFCHQAEYKEVCREGALAATLTATMHFIMALQTREQHIKHDKATSDICASASFIVSWLECILCFMDQTV
jgi:glycine cleavage system pyridoxal-binding protein P